MHMYRHYDDRLQLCLSSNVTQQTQTNITVNEHLNVHIKPFFLHEDFIYSWTRIFRMPFIFVSFATLAPWWIFTSNLHLWYNQSHGANWKWLYLAETKCMPFIFVNFPTLAPSWIFTSYLHLSHNQSHGANWKWLYLAECISSVSKNANVKGAKII